jgi:hypothetical protein
MFTLQEILEMLSERNMYYASEKLERPATPMEAVFHYIRHRKVPPHPIVFHTEDLQTGKLFPEDEYGDQGETARTGAD